MNATLDTAPPGPARPAPVGIGRAHGKAILLGEHSVVYGTPALAVPIPSLTAVVRASRADGVSIDSELYSGPAAGAPPRLGALITAITASLDYVRRSGVVAPGVHVAITSKVPPDRGLGSSAAVAAAVAEAITGAYGVSCPGESRYEIVQEAERHAHGTPSGLDARTVLAPEAIRFHDGRVRPLPIGGDFTFVLADSGVPGSTATAVAGVRAMHDTDLGTAKRIIDALGAITARGELALAEGDLPALGAGMDQAHEHLRALGVSIPELNNLVAAARTHGAIGAKLTGGGLGGCILALSPGAEAAGALSQGLLRAGARDVWQVHVNPSDNRRTP